MVDVIKHRSMIVEAAKYGCGLLGFVLLMWTPNAGKNIVLYLILLILFVVSVIALFWKIRTDKARDGGDS
jgi:hypothetical protein